MGCIRALTRLLFNMLFFWVLCFISGVSAGPLCQSAGNCEECVGIGACVFAIVQSEGICVTQGELKALKYTITYRNERRCKALRSSSLLKNPGSGASDPISSTSGIPIAKRDKLFSLDVPETQGFTSAQGLIINDSAGGRTDMTNFATTSEKTQARPKNVRSKPIISNVFHATAIPSSTTAIPITTEQMTSSTMIQDKTDEIPMMSDSTTVTHIYNDRMSMEQISETDFSTTEKYPSALLVLVETSNEKQSKNSTGEDTTEITTNLSTTAFAPDGVVSSTMTTDLNNVDKDVGQSILKEAIIRIKSDKFHSCKENTFSLFVRSLCRSRDLGSRLATTYDDFSLLMLPQFKPSICKFLHERRQLCKEDL